MRHDFIRLIRALRTAFEQIFLGVCALRALFRGADLFGANIVGIERGQGTENHVGQADQTFTGLNNIGIVIFVAVIICGLHGAVNHAAAIECAPAIFPIFGLPLFLFQDRIEIVQTHVDILIAYRRCGMGRGIILRRGCILCGIDGIGRQKQQGE